MNKEERNVEQWAREKIPALNGFTPDKAARLGDQLQFHYVKPGTRTAWNVVTQGGTGNDRYIQRATQSTIENRDGTEIIKKKHIVRNDFLRSI